MRHLAVVGAVALAGCGGGDSGDDADLERDLVRTVEEQTGTRGVRVDCPETGDTCAVTAPGGIRAKVRRDGRLVQP